MDTTRGRLRWQDDAACQDEDVELFFGYEDELRSDAQRRKQLAKRICAGCFVRQECLEYAQTRPERFGIWGGQDEDERRKDRRRRRERKAAKQREAAKRRAA